MSATKVQRLDPCTSKDNGPACRICLTRLEADARVYNLFDAWSPPWDGMESTIAEDLNRLTSIQVNKEDILSNIICGSCKERLQNACDFVKFAQKNDLQLKIVKSLQAAIDNPSEAMWPKPIELEKNVAGHIYENSMVMDIDIKQEVVSEEDEWNGMEGGCTDLNTEIKVEPEEILPDVTTALQINGSVPSSPKRMKRAADYDHSDVEFLEPVIKQEPLSEEEKEISCLEMPLECMLCSKSFNSISGLKAHVIALHSYKTVKRKIKDSISPAKRDRNDKYVCATCKRTFFTSTDLMVHESCHSKLLCYVCHQNFDNFNQLIKHRKRCKGAETPKPTTLNDVKRLPADEPKPEKMHFTYSEPMTKSDQTNQTTQHTRETLERVDETLEGANELKIPNAAIFEEDKQKNHSTIASSTETLRHDRDTTEVKDIDIKISEITSDFDFNVQSGCVENVTSTNDEETIENINKEVENMNKDTDDHLLSIKISHITSDVDDNAIKISETVKSLTETLQNSSEKIQYASGHPDIKVKEATASVQDCLENVKVHLEKADEVKTSNPLNITPKTGDVSLDAVNQTLESGNEQVTDETRILDKAIDLHKQLKENESIETENKTVAGRNASVEDNNTLNTLNETLENLKATPKNIIGTITKVESDKLESIFGVVSTDSKGEVDL